MTLRYLTRLSLILAAAAHLFSAPIQAEVISLAGQWQASLGAKDEVKVFQSVSLPGSVAEQGLGSTNSRLEMGLLESQADARGAGRLPA